MGSKKYKPSADEVKAQKAQAAELDRLKFEEQKRIKASRRSRAGRASLLTSFLQNDLGKTLG